MRKELSAVALAGAFMIAGAGTASAVEDTGYPSVGPGCEVDSGTVQPDEPFDVDCSGFAPTTTVNVEVSCVVSGASGTGSVVATTTTVRTTAQGTTTWTDSVSEEAICTITASQGAASQGSASEGGGSGSARVVVKAPGAITTASIGGLAATGTDSSTLLWGAGGLGAIALGSVGLIASRRRAHSTN